MIDLVDGAMSSSGYYRGDKPSFLKEVQRSFSLLHAIGGVRQLELPVGDN